ncbi:MAG: hypothetical protein K8I00_09245, partial [Candidatus Omnitrophica bacterium]|nr:hypothetical protein [Candidatus Omnitrophota bacterium]
RDDEGVTPAQAEQYFNYLNETIGDDVRYSDSPIVLTDFPASGRTFQRFIDLLEQWSEKEGLDIMGRVVIHAILDSRSIDKQIEGLARFPMIRQPEFDSRYHEVAMNTEVYFDARWTPRFLPEQWGAPTSPFVLGLNVTPSERAGLLAFLLAEKINTLPGSLSARADRAVLSGFSTKPMIMRTYRNIESMYLNLQRDIEDNLRAIEQELPAEEAAEFQRSLPFAMELMSGVSSLYRGMEETNVQGEEVNLTTGNYHNDFHNQLVTQASLIWNASAGQISSARDLKVVFLSALLHDFHLRRVLSSPDAQGKQWSTPAFVPETVAQVADLFGVELYGQPTVENADYAGRISGQFKTAFQRALSSFIGEDESLPEFYREVVTAIRRTDYASDVAVPEIVYQELAGLMRYSLDSNIQQWLAGEQTYGELLDTLAQRWEIAFQRVADDYRDSVYGEDVRESARKTALTFLRRRQAIDVGFLGSLQGVPESRRAKVFELSNRIELADQSGSFWLTSTAVNAATIDGLSQELPFVSEEGSYPFFVAQAVDTLRNRVMFAELPKPFKERFVSRVDELVAISGDTFIPLRGKSAGAYWAAEREALIEQFGLQTIDRAVLVANDVAGLFDAAAAENVLNLTGQDPQEVRSTVINLAIREDFENNRQRGLAIERYLTGDNRERRGPARRFTARFMSGLRALQEAAEQRPPVTDQSVLRDGRRMPQNPRVFTVNAELRAQLVARYGEAVITSLETANQLDNLYSLNQNLKVVIADLDRLYAQEARKENQPRAFIRGGIIRRFQEQDLSGLLPNTDLDIIVSDSDNYTVRDAVDNWFDNNRVQIMALPVTPRDNAVELDRRQLEQSPFYLLDLWSSYAGVNPADSG